MEPPRAGREYARWKVQTEDAQTAFEVQMEKGGQWLPTEYVDGEVRHLVRGPDYPGTDPSDGTLITKAVLPRLRCVDTPETVIQYNSWILLI